ncbi:cell division protein FtsQ/DivIB [Desulfococcus sp.]|uniref:cell division protein FtsQ/DivIB n=1 Tax=Desulfococcus sp. TaxID=2025834 RepID=UPI003593AFAF
MNSTRESRWTLTRLFITLLLSVFFLILYRELTEWRYFETKQILVTGNSRISEKEIILQAGVEPGTNLVQLNLSAVRKQLLAHPWIEDAQVEWRVPSAVGITVREHQPLAVFDIDRRYTVNVQGKIFKIWDGTEPDHLPVVEGLKFSDLGISGISHSIPFNTVMDVLTSGKSSDCVIPNEMIQRVLLDRELGVTLLIVPNEKTYNINEIKLGYEGYPVKYERLQDLLNYLKHRQNGIMIDSVNLTNPDRIVIAPIHTESLDEDDLNEDDKEEV